ncbi:MAG: response regulator [Verrucomicrobiota bacterium]
MPLVNLNILFKIGFVNIRGIVVFEDVQFCTNLREALMQAFANRISLDIKHDPASLIGTSLNHYDLVIIDSHYSSFDGISLLKLIQPEEDKAKFIVLSSHENLLTRFEAYESGADLFLASPLSKEEFQRTATAIESGFNSPANEEVLSSQANIKDTEADKSSGAIKLTDLLSLICDHEESIEIEFKCMNQEGTLYVYKGTLWHAQTNNCDGTDALLQILRWKSVQISISIPEYFPFRSIYSTLEEAFAEISNPKSLQNSAESSVIA